MNSLDPINNKLTEITDIIVRSDTYFRYCKYLNLPEDPSEYLIIQKYNVLKYARVSFAIVLILDLCKLYHKNEKYSLEKMIQGLIDNFSKIRFAQNIKIDELLELKNKINSDKTINITKKIKTLRDKYYAHIDQQRPEIADVMPKFDEFEYLISLANEISNFIDMKLNDHITWKAIDRMNKADFILRDLLRLEKLDFKEK